LLPRKEEEEGQGFDKLSPNGFGGVGASGYSREPPCSGEGRSSGRLREDAGSAPSQRSGLRRSTRFAGIAFGDHSPRPESGLPEPEHENGGWRFHQPPLSRSLSASSPASRFETGPLASGSGKPPKPKASCVSLAPLTPGRSRDAWSPLDRTGGPAGPLPCRKQPCPVGKPFPDSASLAGAAIVSVPGGRALTGSLVHPLPEPSLSCWADRDRRFRRSSRHAPRCRFRGGFVSRPRLPHPSRKPLRSHGNLLGLQLRGCPGFPFRPLGYPLKLSLNSSRTKRILAVDNEDNGDGIGDAVKPLPPCGMRR